MKAYGSTGIQHNPSGHSMSSYALLKDHSRAAIRPQFMWNEIDCRTSPHAQNIAHWVALSTGLWLKVCISMPRKHDDSGILVMQPNVAENRYVNMNKLVWLLLIILVNVSDLIWSGNLYDSMLKSNFPSTRRIFWAKSFRCATGFQEGLLLLR